MAKNIQDDYKVDTKKTDVDQMFKDLKAESLDSVKEVIQDIEFFIRKRVEVHAEIMGHCDKLKLEIDNMVMMYPDLSNRLNASTQASSEIIKALSELRKKKIDVEEMKINEKLNFFRDVADLKKELREYMKELKEKEGKSDLLDSLI